MLVQMQLLQNILHLVNYIAKKLSRHITHTIYSRTAL